MELHPGAGRRRAGGWLLGAAIGPGTILVVFLIGPIVDWLSRTIFARPETAGRAES
ncbi:MAG: hypothetical protein ABIO99_00915 [Candidatus Limnocylindria bacterium]